MADDVSGDPVHMRDRLALPPLPVLTGEQVILRAMRDSDIDDRLRHPIDPEEEDGYGSSWRREWDGRLYHTREYLTAQQTVPPPGEYPWAIEHDGHGIGSARLTVDADQHCATYSVGLFVAALRGRGLGREVTRLVLDWAFGPLHAHRVQLEVLAGNVGALRCYLACGFRVEGTRREALLYPDGWEDLILMGVLRAEYSRPLPGEEMRPLCEDCPGVRPDEQRVGDRRAPLGRLRDGQARCVDREPELRVARIQQQ